MERILKAFKDLFICENPVKRHLSYVLLMLLPAVAGSFAGYIDKDTPKDVMFVLLGLAVFFLILSIVPLISMVGFGMEFYELRLKGETGIPKVKSELFMKGLKSFPLVFVWTFLYMIVFLVCLLGPFWAAIALSVGLNDNPLAIVGVVIVTTIAICLLMLAVTILGPFMQYVFIKFVKDYEYRAEYFNPFILFDFMKKSFKDTMMVFLKMILAGFVVNSVSSIISMVIVMFMMAFVFIAVLCIPEKAGEDSTYHPIVILLMIPFSTLAGAVQMYATNMLGFAASDQYVEVYKNKIEPTENEFKI